MCEKKEEGVTADTGMWRGGTQKRVRKGGQKEMKQRLRGVDDVDREGMKSWGLRAHQERNVRGMTCAADKNIWACYLFFACFAFPEQKKNFLTSRLAHYTNTQPLPTATACFPVTAY